MHIEEVDRCKCLIITTKTNLPEARAWIDSNLEPLIRQSIPEGIDPPASQLPRRLDKPVYSASSKSYADVLKKQFSLLSHATNITTDNTCPPRKRQAAVIDYDSDTSTDVTAATLSDKTNGSAQSTSKYPAETKPGKDYATELLLLKQELTELRTMITMAVEQFKTAIATLATKTTIQSQSSTAMDTEVDTSLRNNHTNTNTTDLADVIQDLKYELVTIITKTRAVFEQQLFRATNIKNHPSSVT